MKITDEKIERAFVTDFRPFLDDPELIGRWQAARRAGPWPRGGTLAEHRNAVDRAVRAAQRVHTLEYRWNRRFRLWEHDGEPLVELHTKLLTAWRHEAITIAEEREWLLRRLCDEASAGAA
jgi:hypothetical protein